MLWKFLDDEGTYMAALITYYGFLSIFPLLLLALTGGATIGHRLFGLQVWKVRPGAFALQVVIRTLLLCLVLPAVLTSRDGRGFHDVAAGTRIVRP